jgi:hypothetical protein
MSKERLSDIGSNMSFADWKEENKKLDAGGFAAWQAENKKLDEPRGRIAETGAALARGGLRLGEAAVGLTEKVTPFLKKTGFAPVYKLLEELSGVKAEEQIATLKAPITRQMEKLPRTRKGLGGWALNVIGEGVPYLTATVATGGYSLAYPFLISFAVGGEAAYEKAKEGGATEKQAMLEYGLGGLAEGALEMWGVSKLLKFKGAGKGSFRALIKSVRAKLWKQAKGNLKNIGGNALKSALVEGLEEASQEGASLLIPAALRGDVPRKPDGTVDFETMLTQVGEAAAGGALVGGLIPMGMAAVRPTIEAAAPTRAESQAVADAINKSKLTEVEKTILLRELDKTIENISEDVGDEGEGIERIPEKATKPFKATVFRGVSKKTPIATGLAEGTHYTTDKKLAQSFARDYGEGELVEQEITLENPLYLTDESEFGAEANKVIAEEEAKGAVYSEADRDNRRATLMRDILEKQGYDGIVYNEGQEVIVFPEVGEKHSETFAPKELTLVEQFRDKMGMIVAAIEEIRPVETAEISAKRGKRFAEFREILKNVENPRQRVAIAKQVLKGRLKKQIPALEEKFTSDEIDTAYDIITTATLLTEGDVLNATEGLEKLLVDGIIPAPNELKALQKANLISKESIHNLLKHRTKWQKAVSTVRDISFAPWSLLTSFDVSAGGRQGWKVFFRDPVLWLKSVGRGYRMLANENYFNYIELKRKTHPYYQEAIKRGVEETTIDSVTRGEEMFASNMIQKIPGIRASARAFIGTINELRMGWYFKGRELAEGAGMTAKQQRDLADIANDITGRGKLPKVLKSLQDMGLIFFAPRLTMGLLRTPADLVTKAGPGRKMLAGALVSFLGFTLATLYLLDRDDKDNIDVEWNPLSTDFLKVRHGKTRVDITGGYQPILRTIVQLAFGKRKSTETGRVYDAERTEIISRFLQSKLSPHAGLAVDLWRGKTFRGKSLKFTPAGISEQVYQRAAPLFIQDVLEAAKHQGVGTASVIAPLAFHGIGVQSYPTTLTQDVRNLKDRLASQYFGGKKWDELGPQAQEILQLYFPQMTIMEDEAKIDREDFDFIGKILKEADKTGRKIQKDLPKSVRLELEKTTLEVGNITRNLGSGWYLNDKRYKQYQKNITSGLAKVLPIVINNPEYKQAPFEVKRALIQEVIDAVKKEVRLRLITQANFNDLKTKKQIYKI